MTIIAQVLESKRRIDVLVWCHQAMALVDHDGGDHDGGDEDDYLVDLRQFARATRKPDAKWIRESRRFFVWYEPDALSQLLPQLFEAK